ncbi:hypothetical protein ACVIGB_007833 [Bradyrhizobium sp. USDA 4341]
MIDDADALSGDQNHVAEPACLDGSADDCRRNVRQDALAAKAAAQAARQVEHPPAPSAPTVLGRRLPQSDHPTGILTCIKTERRATV